MNRINLDIHKKHELSETTKTVKLVACWWVFFDVNGNAPADADMVACASKELAQEIKNNVYAMFKDNGNDPVLVIGGKRHCGLIACSVEGFNFDTCWAVKEGWAEEGEIVRSIAELANHVDVFDTEQDEGELGDGLYFEEGEAGNID